MNNPSLSTRERHRDIFTAADARRNDSMASAECPECASSIELAANAEVGEILSCPDCGTRLEVRSTSPARLEKAPGVEEDWGE